MDKTQAEQRMRTGDGFIAALDQSGGSTPGALKAYGVAEGSWSSDEEMFDLIHQMRTRIVTSPSFSGGKVIGAILFERTMDGQADGKPVPQLLSERGVVPFLKVDKGLEEEADGVRLMKPISRLDELLDRAVAKGVYGTKMRSVVNRAERTGIAAIVRQQFEVGERIAAKGLMPILEPEVTIKSADRAQSDAMLSEEILAALDRLPEGRQVMLKLSIPATPGTYDAIVDHPAVLRVVALSGGYSREEACRELKRNRGLIASFSRALLEDLRADMSDEEFDRTLGSAIDQICDASTQKEPAAA